MSLNIERNHENNTPMQPEDCIPFESFPKEIDHLIARIGYSTISEDDKGRPQIQALGEKRIIEIMPILEEMEHDITLTKDPWLLKNRELLQTTVSAKTHDLIVSLCQPFPPRDDEMGAIYTIINSDKPFLEKFNELKLKAYNIHQQVLIRTKNDRNDEEVTDFVYLLLSRGNQAWLRP